MVGWYCVFFYRQEVFVPPKVSDTQPAPEQANIVKEETARGARRVVATYAKDFLDGVTLMCMLGVEPEGLEHKKVLADFGEDPDEEAKKTSKKSTKKTSKKAAKKSTKKSTKKTSKKAFKKSTKKTTKKASKKSTKKTTKKSSKSTAKKSTKKTTKKSE